MKFEFELIDDEADDFVRKYLKETYDYCDPELVWSDEDRAYNVNMRKHLKAVIAHITPRGE